MSLCTTVQAVSILIFPVGAVRVWSASTGQLVLNIGGHSSHSCFIGGGSCSSSTTTSTSSSGSSTSSRDSYNVVALRLDPIRPMLTVLLASGSMRWYRLGTD
jgi:hypothetical protein